MQILSVKTLGVVLNVSVTKVLKKLKLLTVSSAVTLTNALSIHQSVTNQLFAPISLVNGDAVALKAQVKSLARVQSNVSKTIPALVSTVPTGKNAKSPTMVTLLVSILTNVSSWVPMHVQHQTLDVSTPTQVLYVTVSMVWSLDLKASKPVVMMPVSGPTAVLVLIVSMANALI